MLGGLLKFIIGFTVAIALLFGAGVATTRYLVTRLTASPPKPIFPEELPEQNQPSLEGDTTVTFEETPESGESDLSTPEEASPVSEAESVPTPAIDPNAYEARVTQPIGLVLRQGPSTETTRLGGVGFNEQLLILEESPDGQWLRVRLEGSDIEGWVRAGNTERVDPGL
jgi:hypothetical protein